MLENQANTVYTKTPLRISFAGGGSDFPEYFNKDRTCKILSCAINQYVYVNVRRIGTLFSNKFRIQYSKVENVDNIEDIENDIIRGCFRLLDWHEPVCISVLTDIPGNSGLGSSSAFCVGLIKALTALRGQTISQQELFEKSCTVELDILKRSMGVQDFLPAIFGGFAYYELTSRSDLKIHPISLSLPPIKKLLESAHLIWTGDARDSGTVLVEQRNRYSTNLRCFDSVADLAMQAFKSIKNPTNDEDDYEFLLATIRRGHLEKLSFAPNILSESAHKVIQALNCVGCKTFRIIGAGNGGFVLGILPSSSIDQFIKLNFKTIIDVAPSIDGAKILYEG